METDQAEGQILLADRLEYEQQSVLCNISELRLKKLRESIGVVTLLLSRQRHLSEKCRA